MDGSQVGNEDEAFDRKLQLKTLFEEVTHLESAIERQGTVKSLKAIGQLIASSDKIINQGTVQDRANNTSEVVLDAQILKINHDLVSKVLHQNATFSSQVYINAVQSLVVKGDEENWDKLAELVIPITHGIGGRSSMLGAIAVQPKEPKQRAPSQRQSKTQLTEQQCPQTLDKLEKADSGAEAVTRVHEQLARIFKNNQRQPVPYFCLIIDPDDFGNTVQNAFQLSFLVRDNLITIELDENNLPIVRLTTSAERQSQRESSQAILTLNFEIWRRMTEHYKIREPMLDTSNSPKSKKNRSEGNGYNDSDEEE